MGTTVVTNAGIAAAIAAESRGMKVSVNRFRLGSQVITPNPSMTEVSGFVYDSGANTTMLSVSALNENTIIYKIRLDETVGSFQIGNIGLVLSSGTLFSITALPSAVQKTAEAAGQAGNVLIFHILIQVSGIASAMDVTINLVEDLQIPEVPTQNHLPSPGSAASPLYHVLNYNNTGMSALATRQTSPLRWNFVYMTPNSPGHLLSSNNLSDLGSISQARTNLGLGSAATYNVGTTNNTVPLIGSGDVLNRSVLPLYQGATTSASGAAGAVPAASAGQTQRYYLAGDGTWRLLGTSATKDVGTSSGNIPELDSSGKLNRSTFPIYVGATSSAAGITGSVPAAAAGQTDRYYLAGDGTWRLLGTSATKDVGTSSGNVPEIGTGNVLARSILPTYAGASSSNSGQAGVVPAAAAGETNHVLTGSGSWKILSDVFRFSGLYTFSDGNGVKNSYEHNLGRLPYLLFPFFECVNANNSWSPGDRIYLLTYKNDSESVDYVYVAADTTYVHLIVRSFKVPNKNSPAGLTNPNLSNWRFGFLYL